MILSKASVIHILNAQVFKNNDATLKHNKQPTTWLPINQLEDFNIYSWIVCWTYKQNTDHQETQIIL